MFLRVNRHTVPSVKIPAEHTCLLGKFTLCEMHTYTGRIDCKVETKKYIYLFEFKRDAAPEAALEQIDSRDYALAFVADSRKLFKIGVSFDSGTRRLAGWRVQ